MTINQHAYELANRCFVQPLLATYNFKDDDEGQALRNVVEAVASQGADEEQLTKARQRVLARHPYQRFPTPAECVAAVQFFRPAAVPKNATTSYERRFAIGVARNRAIASEWATEATRERWIGWLINHYQDHASDPSDKQIAKMREAGQLVYAEPDDPFTAIFVRTMRPRMDEAVQWAHQRLASGE